MEDISKKLQNLNISDSENNINKESKNNTNEEIKNLYILKKRQDKILIIFSGSSLLWCKTQKSIESDIKPDFIFQKEKFIYFNKKFIKDFYNKILKHPRCHPAFISSMNIYNCQILIEQMNRFCGIKKEDRIDNLIYLGKKCHDMIANDPNNPEKILEFKRNIFNMSYCINKFFDTKKKFYKMLILESAPEKMSNSTKPYSILCPIFNEDYISKKETREVVDKKGEKLIEYLEKFLNNCYANVDTYIKENSFEL